MVGAFVVMFCTYGALDVPLVGVRRIAIMIGIAGTFGALCASMLSVTSASKRIWAHLLQRAWWRNGCRLQHCCAAPVVCVLLWATVSRRID